MVSTFILVFASLSVASELPTIKVGVLSYGTVNWEIDTVKHHKLDHDLGINVKAVKLTTKNAAAIALQGGAVDVILTDLFWVIKQGGKFQISPTNKLSGGIYSNSLNQSLTTIGELGVAGGANDKNLLLLKAYLDTQDSPSLPKLKFGAPPLLNEMMIQGKLDGIINFWHYNARLDAAGFVNVLSTSTMLKAVGIDNDVPLLGWVFSKDFADKHPATIKAFLQASQTAKNILLNNKQEWERLRPKMKANSQQEYESLVAHYPTTLVSSQVNDLQTSAEQIFDVVKNIQNQTLFEKSSEFPSQIFFTMD